MRNARNLRTLVYDFPLDEDFGLPFNLVHVEIVKHDTFLEKIQFRPVFQEHSSCMNLAREWCDIQQVDIYSPRVSPKKV